MKSLFGPAQHLTAGSNVVSLDSVRNPASLSPLRQAEAYWAALRAGGDVPNRSAIDPRGLSNLLQYAFILERVAPGLARFRLAGQHMARCMDMDVSGMPLTALFAAGDRERVQAALTQLFDAPAIVEFELKGERCFGRKADKLSMILLPLKSESGTVDRALGVLVSEDAPETGVGKLSVETERHRTLFGVDARPVGDGRAISGRDQPSRSAPEQSGVAHLRLVPSRQM